MWKATELPGPASEFLEEAERYQSLLKVHGVDFPEGSWLKRDPQSGDLVMFNLLRNHRRLVQALSRSGTAEESVLLQLQFLRIPSELIDPLERKQGRLLSESELIALWKQGHGESLDLQMLQCTNGSPSTLTLHQGELKRRLWASVNISSSNDLCYVTLNWTAPAPMHWSFEGNLIVSSDDPKLVSSTNSQDGAFRYLLFLRSEVQIPQIQERTK